MAGRAGGALMVGDEVVDPERQVDQQTDDEIATAIAEAKPTVGCSAGEQLDSIEASLGEIATSTRWMWAAILRAVGCDDKPVTAKRISDLTDARRATLEERLRWLSEVATTVFEIADYDENIVVHALTRNDHAALSAIVKRKAPIEALDLVLDDPLVIDDRGRDQAYGIERSFGSLS